MTDKLPLKRLPTSGTRKGNGSWGGPAKGAAVDRVAKAQPFEPGNQAAVGYHDMSRSERLARHREELFRLGLESENEGHRIQAIRVYAEREEGLAIARNITMDAADVRELTDAELIAQFEAASRAFTAASGGDGEKGPGKPD